MVLLHVLGTKSGEHISFIFIMTPDCYSTNEKAVMSALILAELFNIWFSCLRSYFASNWTYFKSWHIFIVLFNSMKLWLWYRWWQWLMTFINIVLYQNSQILIKNVYSDLLYTQAQWAYKQCFNIRYMYTKLQPDTKGSCMNTINMPSSAGSYICTRLSVPSHMLL